MGTRSGDIDPAVLVHLHRRAGLTRRRTRRPAQPAQRAARALPGATTCATCRHGRPRRDDVGATLALDVYVHRLKGYIGAYFAQLGGVDVISFTAGVGENDAARPRATRSPVSSALGIEIDAERNETALARRTGDLDRCLARSTGARRADERRSSRSRDRPSRSSARSRARACVSPSGYSEPALERLRIYARHIVQEVLCKKSCGVSLGW